MALPERALNEMNLSVHPSLIEPARSVVTAARQRIAEVLDESTEVSFESPRVYVFNETTRHILSVTSMGQFVKQEGRILRKGPSISGLIIEGYQYGQVPAELITLYLPAGPDFVNSRTLLSMGSIHPTAMEILADDLKNGVLIEEKVYRSIADGAAKDIQRVK